MKNLFDQEPIIDDSSDIPFADGSTQSEHLEFMRRALREAEVRATPREGVVMAVPLGEWRVLELEQIWDDSDPGPSKD